MKKLELLLLTALVMMAASCSTTKKITMLQDMNTKTVYSAQEVPQAKIRKGDKLTIYVTCKNAALASPFNLVVGTQNVNEADGSISNVAENTKGYVVDQNGDINFPVLGSLHIEGLTIEELKNDIQNRIIAKNYIKDPIVLAEFINFQITTIGSIGNAVHTITNGSVNIFEAVAMSGGLGNNALFDDVWVIRTEGSKRNIYSLNLQSKTCFDSPAYYLQQGDIIYVKPRKGPDTGKAWSIVNASVGTLSSLSMAFYWLSQLFGFSVK